MVSLIGRIISSPVSSSLFSMNNACLKLHTSAVLQDYSDKKKTGPTGFLRNNDKIYPPQTENEKPRHAFVCHQKDNIKYSPKKMWYIASMVRGLSVDEAIRQLKFCVKGGSTHVLETIKEAQELAVREHNVEFKSNLWVAESFCGKGVVIKGIRRHARMRAGRVEYKYCHYFVRLEEGSPPKDYYGKMVTPEQQLEDWLEKKRIRRITNSL